MGDIPNWKKSGGGVLDEIGSEIVLLGDNLSNRSALMRIGSALGTVSRYAQEGGVDSIVALSGMLKDFLDALAYEGTKTPDQHILIVHDTYNTLQAYFGGVAEESAEKVAALKERLTQGLVDLGFGELAEAPGQAVASVPPKSTAPSIPASTPHPHLPPQGGKGHQTSPSPSTGEGQGGGGKSPAKPRTTPKPAHSPVKTEDTPKLPTKISLSHEDAALFHEFVMETMEHLSDIESRVLSLEADPTNSATINTIFRAFHSTKGGAGILGLTRINVLSHQTEQLLTKVREGEIVPDFGIISVLLAAVDILKRQMGELAAALRDKLAHYEDTVEIESFLARLKQAQAGELKDAIEEGIEEVEKEEGIQHKPTPSPSPLGGAGKGGGEAMGKAPAAAAAGSSQIAALEAGFIKVDTNKLNYLMELVGELVISQALVGQDPVLVDANNLRLAKNIAQMGKVTRTIQDHVLLLRMVPLSAFFQKMNRLVRDLSASLGKRIQLKISGEHTEIDKGIIEELNDPMVHLIRNSIDHGIEPPEKRKAAGKPEVGMVHLNAYHQSGTVVIEIRDDGGGLNSERIRRKAIEKGLIQADAELTTQEIYQLIFLPGFSTAEKTTEVSGRGVGMDVVRENIRKIGGRVELASDDGKGTVITLRLPLTMAIVDGMIVRVGEQRFIIPTTSIRESVQPAPAQVITVKQKGEVISIRGALVPLIRLHTVFSIASARLNPWEALVIIVEHDGMPYGILVDDLLGQQQVVIKNLGKMVQNQRAIAGGAILGDGIVSLILDVNGLIAASRGTAYTQRVVNWEAAAQTPNEASDRRPRSQAKGTALQLKEAS